MLKWLDNVSYFTLAIVAILLLLAPFRPLPHFIEKLIMLKNGNLTKPIDIFDLFFHTAPALLLLIKIIRSALK